MKELFTSIINILKFQNRKGTVRYMFSTILSIAALLGAAAITANDTSYVRLSLSSAIVQEGDSFLLDVYAFAHVPVNAVDITLQFDEQAVKVESVDKGQSVLTIWTEEPRIESNKVILRGGTYRKGFIKEHKIATIKLKANKPGQSVLGATNVTLLAGDGKGTEVAVAETTDTNLNLYVYDQNTSPDSIAISAAVNIYTDIDSDGVVTLKDISIFMSAWVDKKVVYDFNKDNRMNFRDFSIILSDFFFK